MTAPWQPYREPLRATLTRTVMIAVVVGFVVSQSRGGMKQWAFFTLLFLWPSFGGHWVDLFFLNWLRPRLSPSRPAQVGARLLVWFAGGTALAVGMVATILAFGRQTALPPWWAAGVAFIGIELVAQTVLQLRGRPSFFNGLG